MKDPPDFQSLYLAKEVAECLAKDDVFSSSSRVNPVVCISLAADGVTVVKHRYTDLQKTDEEEAVSLTSDCSLIRCFRWNEMSGSTTSASGGDTWNLNINRISHICFVSSGSSRVIEQVPENYRK